MLVRAVLQTSLVLWLVQSTIQGGVRPQTGSLGRLAQSRAAGILGARAYGVGRPGKTAAGRYLGVGGYRPAGMAGGLKPGYGTLGYGAPLGAGLGANLGANFGGAGMGYGRGYGQGDGYGAALGYGGRGYTGNGYGAQLGYGAGGYPGIGRGYGAPAVAPSKGQGLKPSKMADPVSRFTGAGPRGGQPVSRGERADGYGLGAGYLGAGIPEGYGAGFGAGAYQQGVRGGKPIGYNNGFGSEMYGAADGYGAGLGAAGLGAGGLGAAGLGNPGLLAGTGLGSDAKARKYGGTGAALDPLVAGGVGQLPYNAPVIAAGLEGDAGYAYGAEQLGLGAEVTKTAAKYGAGGFGAALSTGSQGAYAGQKDGTKASLSGAYGNGYKG
nr:fibroin heavy chain isoform X3 [Misgurnus anguillicaudatus]